MPKRTNEEQEVIALLRRLLAREGCEIIESAMLRDARTGDEREVDVVMRCPVSEDVTITVSCEVVFHKRPMSVEWVQQQLRKHADLPTNTLILVSWSGFTKGALKVGKASTEPVTQMIHVRRDAKSKLPSLFLEQVNLTPRGIIIIVESPRGALRVRALMNNKLFTTDGTELPENASQLATLILKLSHVNRSILTQAHHHPERESLKSFRLSYDLPESVQLFLRKEPSQELHRIVQVELEGVMDWTQSPVDMQVASFGEVAFGHGLIELAGRKTLAVARPGEEESTLSGLILRVYPEGKAPKPARMADDR